MNQEIESKINEKWKIHLESWRLKLLVELGEDWVVFLNQFHFTAPRKDVARYPENIFSYQNWEIAVHYPTVLQREDIFLLGMYEYGVKTSFINNNEKYTSWLINGDRISGEIVRGKGLFEFMTNQPNVEAEEVLNTLWNDFELKGMIEMSARNKYT